MLRVRASQPGIRMPGGLQGARYVSINAYKLAPKFTFTSSSRKLAVRAVAAPPGALSTEPPPEEIIPAVDAEVPGIIPPSGTIPNAPGGYYRTTWSDETDEAVIDEETGEVDETLVSRIGKGFERERGFFTPSALDVDVDDDGSFGDSQLITSQSQVFDLVETSFEFEKTVKMKGQVKVRVLFKKKKKSFQSTETLKVSDQSLTCALVRNYTSEPVMKIDTVTQDVKLNAAARRLLRNQGPKAFHETYGTHYVAGFTIGGTFTGHLQLRFVSKETTRKGKGSVAKALSKVGKDLTSASEFQDDLNRVDGISGNQDSVEGFFTAPGWITTDGKEDPEGNVTNMEELINASNDIRMNPDGARDEAVLARYENLSDYQESRMFFEDRNTDPNIEPFIELPEQDYFTVSELIDSEFLALDFTGKQAEDLPNAIFDPEGFENNEGTAELQQQILDFRRQAQEQITRLFTTDDDARDNWVSLAAYVKYVQTKLNILQERGLENLQAEATSQGISQVIQLKIDDSTEEGELAEKGRRLAAKVFLDSALRAGTYNDLRNKIQSRVNVEVDISLSKAGVLRNVDPPTPPKRILIESVVNIVFEGAGEKTQTVLISTLEGSSAPFRKTISFNSDDTPGLDALSRPKPESNATITAFQEPANFALSKNAKTAVTLLAPQNSAFNQLTSEEQETILNDSSKLTEILDLHILTEPFTKQQLISRGTTDSDGNPIPFPLATRSGAQLNVIVSGDEVTFTSPDGSSSGKLLSGENADIQACNSIVHVIDGVLRPADTEDSEEQNVPGTQQVGNTPSRPPGDEQCEGPIKVVEEMSQLSTLRGFLQEEEDKLRAEVVTLLSPDVGPSNPPADLPEDSPKNLIGPNEDEFKLSNQEDIGPKLAQIDRNGFEMALVYTSISETTYV